MLIIRIFYKHLGVGEEKQIGQMEISNDGTGDLQSGNYAARIFRGDGTAEGFDIWKHGKVKGFPRESRGPWDLLFLALRPCVGFRNLKPKKMPSQVGPETASNEEIKESAKQDTAVAILP